MTDKTRTVTSHQVNECNSAIHIIAGARDPKMGASHDYAISISGRGIPDYVVAHLNFQNGPIKEVGTNGITHEALLAVLIDRLEGFQSGPYACDDNALALEALENARAWLHNRTKARVARGVEGTHTV